MKHTATPWEVFKLERPQLRPYFVARKISESPSFSHYEQLREESGQIASFESEEDALAAIDAALAKASA